MFSIGIGYDSHRFHPGRKLIIGGVEIKHTMGLLGHSDGDVLVHAVIDSLLGAASMADIGTHFPDTDPAYKDASSLRMLKYILSMLRAEGWDVLNVDATVVTEEPRLAPYIPKMVERLKETGLHKINIKAKTNEGMGFIGRKEGIAAFAVALITRNR